MAGSTETLGNMTIVNVGAGADATAFEPICVFGGEAEVDFGTYSTNKEYCLSRKEPYVALNDLEFGSQTFQGLWSEGTGDAGKKIVEDAHKASDMATKTITVQIEANNSKGANGTQYTANFLVTGYKFMFKKGEVNKYEFTVEQLTTPAEVVAAATTT